MKFYKNSRGLSTVSPEVYDELVYSFERVVTLLKCLGFDFRSSEKYSSDYLHTYIDYCFKWLLKLEKNLIYFRSKGYAPMDYIIISEYEEKIRFCKYSLLVKILTHYRVVDKRNFLNFYTELYNKKLVSSPYDEFLNRSEFNKYIASNIDYKGSLYLLRCFYDILKKYSKMKPLKQVKRFDYEKYFNEFKSGKANKENII